MLKLLSTALDSNSDSTAVPKNSSGDGVEGRGFMVVGQLSMNQEQKEQDDDPVQEDHLPDDTQAR